MFTRTACGFAVWVGLTGAAAAQSNPLPADPGAPMPGAPVVYVPGRGDAGPTYVPEGRPARLVRPSAVSAVPEPTAPQPTTRLGRLLRPISIRTGGQDEAPKPRAVTPAPNAGTPMGTPLGMPMGAPTTPGTASPLPGTTVPGTAGLPPFTPNGCDLYGCEHFDCDSCGACACGPPGRFWVSAQWLYWATSGQHIPALATTAPLGTPVGSAGTLDNPQTTVLYGNQRANNNFRNGLMVNAGFWLNQQQTCGIEGNFFFLGDSNQGASFGSPGSTIISRPFVNALTGRQDVELVSYPGILSGTTTSTVHNSVLGAGVNGISNLCCTPCGRLDLIYGYQYLNVADEVVIRENLTALPGSAVAAGTTYQIEDRFKTSNNFHGGVIGLSGERRYGVLFVGARASVGLGVNHQIIDINGQTTITPPGGVPQTYAGGLYAQPSNIGHYTQNKFAVMPMVGLRVGAQLTPHARVFVGYNFLYLSNVARAGDQIDPRVNPNFLPPRAGPVTGPALPAFLGKTTDFWMQGVSVGFEYRF